MKNLLKILFCCTIILISISYYETNNVFGEKQTKEQIKISFNDATELFQNGNYNQAIVIYDQILESEPNNISTLNMKGIAYSNMEQYTKSLKQFYKVLESNPENARALAGMGVGFGNLGEYSESLSYLKKADEVNPNNTVIKNYKNIIENTLKKYPYTPTEKPTNTMKQTIGNIPNWVKQTTNWWAITSISDEKFTNNIQYLIKKEIIPIIIGGSQDLTYANYRAYDGITAMINIVNVDSNFDLGDSSKPIKNNSFLGKVILEQPYNLFNYSTLGYQTYFNSQEEIDLMDKLYFEAYRLGEISSNIQLVEPVMRDANVVSVDLKSIRSAEVSVKQKYSPNGFDGKEICTISRYAGISNKVSSFGIYEYKPSKDDDATSMLVSQMIWYFIEGVNCRVDDDALGENHLKYTVLIEDDELIFYKSTRTGRWWIEIPFLPNFNNKLRRHTLLPCTHFDYEEGCKGKIPERWYKAFKKNCV